ncbi:MAG: PH domain-containing protein [Candidatus Hodarchaeales archaeon]|jgi:membrane protein YdbS with pleckstrin-like domain
MNEIPRIVGSDTPLSTKEKPRIIRPSTNFLYKNYFLFILTAIVFNGGMILIFFFITILFGNSRGPTVQKQLNDVFWFITIGFSILWILILIAYVIGFYIYFNQMKFIVHGSEIVVVKGLINKTEKHVPYRTVTHISMRSGPFDRLFNIGTIEIQTAGGSGSSSLDQTAEEKLEGIKVYREVRDYILGQLRQFQLKESKTGLLNDFIDKKSSHIVENDMVEVMSEIKSLLADKFQRLEESLEVLTELIRESKKQY